MAETPKDNQTGYCRPPKHMQFVKGQSGNPKGRPKGSQNLASILIKEGRRKVVVKINGQLKTVTKLEAGLMQLWNKAAAGDLRALQQALYWESVIGASGPNELVSPSIEDADRAVIESMLKRIKEAGSSGSSVISKPTGPDDSEGCS